MGNHIYLDMNLIADMVSNRAPLVLEKVSNLKLQGVSFPYSPAHMEEVAVIFRSQDNAEMANDYVWEHLTFINDLSDSMEYLPPFCDAEIRVVDECPSVCFKRVVDHYECSYWAESNDEVFMCFKNNESFRKVFGEDGVYLFEERRKAFGIGPSINALGEKEVFADEILAAAEAKLCLYGLDASALPTPEELQKSHRKIELIVPLLLNLLEEIGYRGEKFTKTRSRMHDVSHAIYATRADFFVSRDMKFLSKIKAVYHFLGISTVVLTADEFLALPQLDLGSPGGALG